MNLQTDGIFDSIESAHDYVKLLVDVVREVRSDLENSASGGEFSRSSRGQDAIHLALYNLDKLQHHMRASSRILNDLRSIRRLLFEERQTTVDARHS